MVQAADMVVSPALQQTSAQDPAFQPPALGGAEPASLFSPSLVGQSTTCTATDPQVGHAAAAAELLASLRHTLHVGVSIAHQRLTPEAEMVSGGLKSIMNYSCHCGYGFFSNEQVIANLLHIIVNLALFNTSSSTPTTSKTTDPPSEEEQRELGWKADAAEGPEAPTMVDADSQANVCNPNKKMKQRERSIDKGPGSRYGVRIGGGYHLVKPEKEEIEIEETWERARSDSPAEERLREYSANQKMHREANASHHPYAHGAPSEATPASRFIVGAYSSLEMSKYYERPSLRASEESPSPGPRRGSGAGCPVNLYRVLRPAHGPHAEVAQAEYYDLSSEFQANTAGEGAQGSEGHVAQGMDTIHQPDAASQPEVFSRAPDQPAPETSPETSDAQLGSSEERAQVTTPSVQHQTLQRTKPGPVKPEPTKTPNRGPDQRGRAMPESPRTNGINRSRSASARSGVRKPDPQPVGSASKAAMNRSWNSNAHVKSQCTGV